MSDTFEVEGLAGHTWEVVSVHRDQIEATDRARSLDRRQTYPRLRVVVNTTDADTGAQRRLVTFEANAGERYERERAKRHAALQTQRAHQARASAHREAKVRRYVSEARFVMRIFAGLTLVLLIAATLIGSLNYLR